MTNKNCKISLLTLLEFYSKKLVLAKNWNVLPYRLIKTQKLLFWTMSIYRYDQKLCRWFMLSIWRPSRLSELTRMVFDTGLTHLGSEASNLLKQWSQRTSLIKFNWFNLFQWSSHENNFQKIIMIFQLRMFHV